MTKKDIKAGDIVLLKDGRRCIVMPDINDSNEGLTLYGILDLSHTLLASCNPAFKKIFSVIASFNKLWAGVKQCCEPNQINCVVSIF
jgi:hypothetical protein